jgi:hypothetical protein
MFYNYPYLIFKVNIDALHILYDYYPSCLSALWWVDITSSNENATLDAYEISNGQPHPLVMVAWRCLKLKELVIIGKIVIFCTHIRC